VLATGGLSFPKLGTDGAGFRVCEAHGHTLRAPYPALTPLLGSHPGGAALAGVSLYSVDLQVMRPGARRRMMHRVWLRQPQMPFCPSVHLSVCLS
jgi:predicted flavoprotein YhiN